MVQRKVGNNDNTLKTEKIKPTIIKPTSLQNHEFKSKGADHLKVIKMKKSRSTKRPSKVAEISLHEKPTPFVTPTSTPSPKKASSCKSTSSYTSPNYMKSTSSSDARKEKTTKLSSTKSSSLKKMKALIKGPSFKHTRASGCNKKVVVLERATCSSTLKDSKFPKYLQLKAAATEAEGNSVFKVCPYNYCSLNGHHHVPAPPLNRFLSSRRRAMKARPAVVSPRTNEAEDFFIQVYVPDTEVAAQVSESLSDGQCSEIEFENDHDQTEEDSSLSGMKFNLEDEYYLSMPVQRQTSFESEFFGENSDMEWEEGQIPATQHVKFETYVETVYSSDQEKHELNKSGSDDLEFMADEYSTICHDEIEVVECLLFSDTDSLPDSESTQTGEMHMEEPVMVTDNMKSNQVVRATVHTTRLDESVEKQARTFPIPLDIVTEAQTEEPEYSYLDLFETDCDNDDSNEDASPSINDGGNLSSGKVIEEWKDNGSSKVELHPGENVVAEVKTSGMQDLKKTEESYTSPAIRYNNNQEANKCNSNTGESDSNSDSCNELQRLLRCRKANKDTEEDQREFNPRGPNFLTLEPEPEAEKVDLRHLEMDERRNTEEWMLDYALQKTVNQLAPARNRKVALLVEAFESVLPIPKFENHMRKNSTGFTHARPIQACS